MAYIKSRPHAAGRQSSFNSSTAIGLMLAALPGIAAAQQADPSTPAPGSTPAAATLPTVKVQAAPEGGYKTNESASPKATAALIDTPQTVTVINEKLIREQGATTLTEALRATPGVGAFYLGENGSTSTGDAIYMRGSDASSSIFVDGIRDIGTISRDVFNIAQVEVLKGAAGFDIGRGAATGAINLITKQPELKNSGSATVGFGSARYKRATGDINRQLSDHAALRLNLMAEDSGVAGRDEVKNKRWAFAPSLALGLGTPNRVTFDYLHVKQDNIPDGGVYTIGLPGFTGPISTPVDAARTAAIGAAPRVRSTNIYGSSTDHDDVGANMLTAIVEHDLSGGAVIRNTSRWGKTHQDYQLSSFMGAATSITTTDLADPSTWTLARNMNNKDITNEILTNQTNLSGSFNTGSVSHSFTSGIEFIREQQLSRTFAQVAGTTLTPVNVYAPTGDNGYARYLTGAYTYGKTNTIGLYAGETATLTPSWLANIGLRWDHYDTVYNSYAATGVKTPLNDFGNLLSGKIGLLYKPTANSSVYASWAVTRQPPGGSNFALSSSTTSAANPDVAAQMAKSSEIGAKWDALDKQVSLTAALYRTQYSDTVAQDTDGSYYHTGEKQVQGIELGVVGNLTPAWNVSAGFTTMNTTVSGTAVTQDGSAVLAYNPDKALTLWSTYKLPMGLTFGGGPRYSGEMKRGKDSATGGTPSYIAGYWVFDGMASYRVNKALELQMNLFNLFDRSYIASINKSGYRYNPGTPRSGTVSANVSF
jgi:catecholate siderophore receptor